jgi:ferric enterobactin receptor
MYSKFSLSHLAAAVMLAYAPGALQAQEAEEPGDEESTAPLQSEASQAASDNALELQGAHVVGTAEEELKQAPGVSIITAEDIRKRPPSNDLSDIIRREPGVNLTGNSASGARGNNRQIDLRGMGPENTLILIDGKPTTSRNAVRYGWNGDRDTRGETNWVPAEEVERIEILRGPAAARYGSGAMGGVVNIITKRPTDAFSGSLNLYTMMPEDKAEGVSKRTNFSLSGPLTDALTFRVYGGLNKTDADDIDINADAQNSALAAGREGVRNKDINGLLSWRLNDSHTLELSSGYSRQGNIYTGDTMNSNGGSDVAFIQSLYGAETNVMQRNNFDLTHLGEFDWGSTKSSLTYDYTRNWRLNEGLAGGPEGAITNGAGAAVSRLRNTRASSEVSLPLSLGGLEQVLTVGGEYLYETLNDQGSSRAQSFDPGNGGTNLEGFDRSTSKINAESYALYVEDNIELTEKTTLTPGVRLDHHNQFGSNWSPSLNASHKLTDALTLKGGVARAYKTPNLYQSNPNYLLYSMGNGCNANETNSGGCYLLGNENLDPETSINKEIGLAFDKGTWRTSATYFRNDYKNKIIGGNEYISILQYTSGGVVTNRRVQQWENSKKAVVEGVEGNLFMELTPSLTWNTNVTYMIESEDKETGEPLSVIPEYTVNTTFDWQATEKLSLQLAGTYFGKQESPTFNYRTAEEYDESAQQDVDPYGLVDLSAGYEFTENYTMRVGINNVFDKQILRGGNASSSGANTYNQPGRAAFVSLNASF